MEKKTVIIEVQTESGVKQLDRLSAKFDEVYGDVLPLTASIGELEDQLYQMALEGQKGTKEFNLLAAEAGRLKKTLQQVDLEVDGLSMTTANKLGGALSGVTAGFELAQGAMGAMGVESEKVQEALLKVQSAMAIAQGVQGLKESAASFKALGQSASAAFKGMSNGAKIFAATGIGLLITAVGYLVANFEELKNAFSSVSSQQKLLNSTMSEYRQGAQDATKKTIEVGNAFELAKKGVISKGEALKTYNDTLGDSFGKATDINEAEKLFRDKTEAYIQATALRAQANALLTKAAEQRVEQMLAEKEAEKLAAQKASNDPYSIINIAKKNGEAMAKQSKQQADELEKMSADLMKQANEIENINNIKSDSEQKYNDEADQRRKDAAAKAKETRDKTAEEEKAAREKALAEQKAFEEEFEQGAINLADRAKERRDAEREATLAAYEADRANKNKFHADLAEIEDKYREEKEKKDAEQAEKELARKKQLADSSLEATKSGLQGISDIIGAFAGKSKAQQKKAFEAQKKLNIAMATIDTIKGAVSAFTGMTASIPGPVGLALGAVAAAGVTASGIANVKKISSTQFDSGSSPSGTSTGGGGGAPNLPASQPAQFNVVGNSGTNQLANVEGNTPVKAYVVSGDVTSAQSLERNKIVTATL